MDPKQIGLVFSVVKLEALPKHFLRTVQWTYIKTESTMYSGSISESSTIQLVLYLFQSMYLADTCARRIIKLRFCKDSPC